MTNANHEWNRNAASIRAESLLSPFIIRHSCIPNRMNVILILIL